MDTTRRVFLSTAASGLVLGTRSARASAQGASDRVRIGVIGTGGRARGLMNQLKTAPGVEMVAVCDAFEARMRQAAEIAGSAAVQIGEYRRILDDKSIDAVLIGSPDHWHRTMTIDAVAAGKDVYIEKPISHSIEDGEAMVAAVEASKQIVQCGMQQRSWEHWITGKQIIDSGQLGRITFVQTYWYQHARAGKYAPERPAGLDWKAWLGPAPDQPFDPIRFAQWRHFWDFGGGGTTDLMTHWIDVVQWYMNVEAPVSAYSSGHTYVMKAWQAPDTVMNTLEYPAFTAVYLGAYISRVDDGGIEFRGENGTLKIDRARLAVYKDDAPYAAGSLTPEPEILVLSKGDGSIAHLQNWIDCIRSRQVPNAPIRVGHHAARTSHLANASLKAKKRVDFTPA
jgi:predicted dehydrogenase